MKKLNALLHETTIINFPFFIKLIKRYYIISFTIPLLILGYALYFYKQQNTIYIKDINLTIKQDGQLSTSRAILQLSGKNTNQFTAADIMAISKSPDFKEVLIEELLNDKRLPLINLSSLRNKQHHPLAQDLQQCGDNRACKHKILAEKIDSTYSLKENPILERMLKLEVKVLSPLSADVLLENITTALLKFRLNQLRHSLTEQKKMTKELLAQKTQTIRELNYNNIQKRIEKNKEQLSSLNKQITNLENLLQKQQIKTEIKQTQYEQTKKLEHTNIASAEDKLDHIKQLKDEINKLKRDIRALELSASQLAQEDQDIIANLNKDLQRKQLALQQLQAETPISFNEKDFITNKQKHSKNIEFDYLVNKRQLTKLKRKLRSLKKERDQVQEQLEQLYKVAERGEPIDNYVKLLNKQLMQLQILETTLVPDIIIDKHPSELQTFKRISKGKVIFFTLTATLFTLFLLITIRYLLDPRIYDEYELQHTFEDLEVIGKAPEFRS